jgi:MFS family permease
LSSPQPTTPTPPWALPVHIASAALLTSTSIACFAILPVIATTRFGAHDLQSVLITAAPTASYVVAIFFNHVFARRRFGTYLFQYWLLASAPLLLMGWAQNFWHLAVPFLIACIGGAGYHPIAGELLKRLYPDTIRGRVYALIWGCSTLGSAAVAYALGVWLKADPDAFRVFLPAIALAHGLGLLGYFALWAATRQTRTLEPPGGLLNLVAPVLHMRSVLKADPTFARYEASYMAYGIGWMICWALVPLLAVERLGLQPGGYAHLHPVPYAIAVSAAMLPAGWLMDRLGAMRSTAISFALLALYPIGLIFTDGPTFLLLISVYYGIAHAGANMGWMLGPVSLAPSRDKVAQYVAIHSTLVGVRGMIFQFLGVWIYNLTHSFTIPLLIAAAGFALSAVQMRNLYRSALPAPRPTPAITPTEGE